MLKLSYAYSPMSNVYKPRFLINKVHQQSSQKQRYILSEESLKFLG